MKRRRVRYALRADGDFAWIYATIAGAGGPGVAFDFVQRVRAFCERMDIVSERGSRRDDLRPGLRIVGFERRVTIAFLVDDEHVTILRIFYGGRNWEADLR